MQEPNDVVGFGLLAVAFFAGGWWVLRPLARAVEKPLLRPPEAVLQLGPNTLTRPARHPRLELEFHAHRHLGLKRRHFASGFGAGWSLHVGLGVTCLCVDFFRRGRRP